MLLGLGRNLWRSRRLCLFRCAGQLGYARLLGRRLLCRRLRPRFGLRLGCNTRLLGRWLLPSSGFLRAGLLRRRLPRPATTATGPLAALVARLLLIELGVSLVDAAIALQAPAL